jgi:hypothetical protein
VAQFLYVIPVVVCFRSFPEPQSHKTSQMLIVITENLLRNFLGRRHPFERTSKRNLLVGLMGSHSESQDTVVSLSVQDVPEPRRLMRKG